ncbi:MAG TPA: hypothetical protein VK210_06995 [Terriglobia bacterium]|nr:hypothetical protein [Terriglobia bacterium]
MERDALRRQLYDEIQSEFDAKLKESKKQKYQIEEEFEQSSEKWRIERRRLNAEIDRLESALAEAKQPVRERPESKAGPALAPEDVDRRQTAAEEKLRESTQSWEKERTRLLSEISRLQENIAEVIERSNNPLRSNQIDRQKLETKYDDAIREKRVVEEALIAAKSEWEKEKLNLVNEAMKHRAAPAPTRSPASDTLANDLEKARKELSTLKDAHAAELQNLKARLEKARTDLEEKLRDSENARGRLELELEKAKQASAHANGAASEELVRLKLELEKAQKTNKQLERQMKEANSSGSSDIVDNLRRQYERRIQDVIQENNQLSEKVKNATTLLEVDAPVSAISSAAIGAEVARIEGMIVEIAKIIDDPETELSTVIRKNVERAELDAYLRGMLFSLGRGRAL